MLEDARSFVECAKQLTAGRIARSGVESSQLAYNPVGYQVSAAERAEQEANGVIRRLKQERQAQHEREQLRRALSTDLES